MFSFSLLCFIYLFPFLNFSISFGWFKWLRKILRNNFYFLYINIHIYIRTAVIEKIQKIHTDAYTFSQHFSPKSNNMVQDVDYQHSYGYYLSSWDFFIFFFSRIMCMCPQKQHQAYWFETNCRRMWMKNISIEIASDIFARRKKNIFIAPKNK